MSPVGSVVAPAGPIPRRRLVEGGRPLGGGPRLRRPPVPGPDPPGSIPGRRRGSYRSGRVGLWETDRGNRRKDGKTPTTFKGLDKTPTRPHPRRVPLRRCSAPGPSTQSLNHPFPSPPHPPSGLLSLSDRPDPPPQPPVVLHSTTPVLHRRVNSGRTHTHTRDDAWSTHRNPSTFNRLAAEPSNGPEPLRYSRLRRTPGRVLEV